MTSIEKQILLEIKDILKENPFDDDPPQNNTEPQPNNSEPSTEALEVNLEWQKKMYSDRKERIEKLLENDAILYDSLIKKLAEKIKFYREKIGKGEATAVTEEILERVEQEGQKLQAKRQKLTELSNSSPTETLPSNNTVVDGFTLEEWLSGEGKKWFDLHNKC